MFQSSVAAFHAKIGHAAPGEFQPLSDDLAKLRANLILEEALETVKALGFEVGWDDGEGLYETLDRVKWELHPRRKPHDYEDPRPFRHWPEVIDGLCDLLVVTFGTFVAMGLEARPFFGEVMRANLTKVGGPVRPDGKQLKPKDWKPPQITRLLGFITKKVDWMYLPDGRIVRRDTVSG